MSAVKVGLVSLGCAKNLCDSENMLHLIKEAGYEIVNEEAAADVIVVNTCAFIESAQTEAINTILEMAQYKDAGTCKGIIVAGCMPQLFKEEVLREMPEADALLGTGSFSNIVPAIEAVLRGEKYMEFAPNDRVCHAPDRVLTSAGHYAYLKIADGCNNKCSYCLIPSIRGSFRSRTIEDIVAEAKGLAERGVRELILVAQDLTYYGADIYSEKKLFELLLELQKIDDIGWIRLQYLYPERIDDRLLDAIAECPKVVHYFDIPVQHGSPAVLKRMGRASNVTALEALFDKIRARFEDAVLRTSIIVGFPGETEEEFSELLSFVERVQFDKLGVFEYSPMDTTPAAAMEAQIPKAVKHMRYDALMDMQYSITNRLLRERVGSKFTVITDGFDDDLQMYSGRSYGESPETDGVIYFAAGHECHAGEFVNVTALDVMDYDLFAQETGASTDMPVGFSMTMPDMSNLTMENFNSMMEQMGGLGKMGEAMMTMGRGFGLDAMNSGAAGGFGGMGMMGMGAMGGMMPMDMTDDTDHSDDDGEN